MNTRLIGSLLIVAGFLSGCASHTTYPAASPSTSSVVHDEGDSILRGDGTPAAPQRWAWVQRPRASSPAPEAPVAPSR